MVYIDICGYIHSQICTCIYSKGIFFAIKPKIKDLSSRNVYVFQEKQDLEGRWEGGEDRRRDVNVNFPL